MNLTRWKSPSQRQKSEELLDFHHGLLRSSKTSIRLAQILPGSGTKRVAINLIDSFVSGPGQQPYDALSYTWGDDLRTKYVKCNNKRLAVTTTLLEALQRFRDSDKVVTLWIDQICICQGRISERNDQVQLMGDIFRAASKVVVWLGNDYDDSAAGMQLAKQLLHIAQSRNVSRLGADDLETHGLPKRGHRRWKAFAAILRRPWFWRTWVVQEVVLNPHVELVLGPNSLSWDELESIIALLEGPLPTDWQLDQAISAAELPFSRINKIRSRHRRTITTLLSPVTPDAHLDGGVVVEPESMKNPTNADDPELLDLLLMSRGLGASDPRDRIYALLGLSKHDINPDYSMPPESVFTDFALQTIGAATLALSKREALSLDLSSDVREVRQALIMFSCAGRQNQHLRGLASWVPDWTVDMASRPLVLGLGTQRFAAGGGQLGIFDWQCDSGLQLSGILVDTVQAVGHVLLDMGGKHDPHALISAWWEEAASVAVTRIARSPGSTNYTDAFEAMRRRLALCRHGYYVGEMRHRRRGSLLDDANTVMTDANHNANQTLVLGPTRGRVLFASSTGFLGLVPHGTREGDVIVIVRGVDVPYVLRPQGEAYELIGEAYVEGVMQGEALGMGFMGIDVMIR